MIPSNTHDTDEQAPESTPDLPELGLIHGYGPLRLIPIPMWAVLALFVLSILTAIDGPIWLGYPVALLAIYSIVRAMIATQHWFPSVVLVRRHERIEE